MVSIPQEPEDEGFTLLEGEPLVGDAAAPKDADITEEPYSNILPHSSPLLAQDQQQQTLPNPENDNAVVHATEHPTTACDSSNTGESSQAEEPAANSMPVKLSPDRMASEQGVCQPAGPAAAVVTPRAPAATQPLSTSSIRGQRPAKMDVILAVLQVTALFLAYVHLQAHVQEVATSVESVRMLVESVKPVVESLKVAGDGLQPFPWASGWKCKQGQGVGGQGEEGPGNEGEGEEWKGWVPWQACDQEAAWAACEARLAVVGEQVNEKQDQIRALNKRIDKLLAQKEPNLQPPQPTQPPPPANPSTVLPTFSDASVDGNKPERARPHKEAVLAQESASGTNRTHANGQDASTTGESMAGSGAGTANIDVGATIGDDGQQAVSAAAAVASTTDVARRMSEAASKQLGLASRQLADIWQDSCTAALPTLARVSEEMALIWKAARVKLVTDREVANPVREKFGQFKEMFVKVVSFNDAADPSKVFTSGEKGEVRKKVDGVAAGVSDLNNGHRDVDNNGPGSACALELDIGSGSKNCHASQKENQVKTWGSWGKSVEMLVKERADIAQRKVAAVQDSARLVGNHMQEGVRVMQGRLRKARRWTKDVMAPVVQRAEKWWHRWQPSTLV